MIAADGFQYNYLFTLFKRVKLTKPLKKIVTDVTIEKITNTFLRYFYQPFFQGVRVTHSKPISKQNSTVFYRLVYLQHTYNNKRLLFQSFFLL